MNIKLNHQAHCDTTDRYVLTNDEQEKVGQVSVDFWPDQIVIVLRLILVLGRVSNITSRSLSKDRSEYIIESIADLLRNAGLSLDYYSECEPANQMIHDIAVELRQETYLDRHELGSWWFLEFRRTAGYWYRTEGPERAERYIRWAFGRNS